MAPTVAGATVRSSSAGTATPYRAWITFASYLRENLHAPAAIEAVMNRFTVRAVSDYIVGQLAAAARLAPGT